MITPIKIKKTQLLIHVVCCIGILFFPILSTPGRDGFGALHDFFALRDLVYNLLIVSFFYFNYFYAVPKLYFEKKYVQFFFSTVICLLLIAVLPRFIGSNNFTQNLHPPEPPHSFQQPPPPSHDSFPLQERGKPNHIPESDGPLFIYFFNHNFFFALIVFIASLFIKTYQKWKETEQEKLTAELSYLKAQINPHFLFNTLNGIYSLAIEENSTNTANALVRLSEMMRYVISDAHYDFVSLEKEIKYISSYIELQRIRFSNTVNITYSVSGSTNGQKIAPILLISFVENAFKHGINPEENSVIFIGIQIHRNELTLKVTNKKVSVRHEESVKGGLGIENTKRRLQLLYPSKYILEIENWKEEFSVLLTLDLS